MEEFRKWASVANSSGGGIGDPASLELVEMKTEYVYLSGTRMYNVYRLNSSRIKEVSPVVSHYASFLSAVPSVDRFTTILRHAFPLSSHSSARLITHSILPSVTHYTGTANTGGIVCKEQKRLYRR